MIGLRHRHERGFASSAAAALATAPLATEIGIIDLNQARQRLALVSFQHHLHQFVLDPPCRIVGDSQLTMQLHCGNAFLGLREQVNGLKPYAQRQLGRVEYGACRHRGLPVALVALLAYSGVQLTAFLMPAVRAFEAIPPAPPVKRLEALLLSSVGGDEFCQTETFLKLCLISHDTNFVNLNNNIDTTYYIKKGT